MGDRRVNPFAEAVTVVPVYAAGPCSELLAGKVDNAFIFRVMERALR